MEQDGRVVVSPVLSIETRAHVSDSGWRYVQLAECRWAVYNCTNVCSHDLAAAFSLPLSPGRVVVPWSRYLTVTMRESSGSAWCIGALREHLTREAGWYQRRCSCNCKLPDPPVLCNIVHCVTVRAWVRDFYAAIDLNPSLLPPQDNTSL